MSNTIKVTVKSSYGKVRVYPACKTAELFSDLSGSVTFSEREIGAIKALGYSVQVAPEAPDWL